MDTSNNSNSTIPGIKQEPMEEYANYKKIKFAKVEQQYDDADDMRTIEFRKNMVLESNEVETHA